MSNPTTTTTAVVTGATSGLGFEAAAQIAEQGYDRVIITGRSPERAERARQALADRTGLDVFTGVVVDLNKTESVQQAVGTIADLDGDIDVLLLNAGMVAGSKKIMTGDGVEVTFASSLIGHHQLTMGLLGHGALSDQAHIVIAGSEAARGDVPTFRPTDLHEFAADGYGGDLVAAAEGLIRGESAPYKPSTAYADAKMFVAWWAAELSRRLPDGMTVNAVSPGSAPDTDAGRNANFFMKYVLIPVFKYVPGQSHSIEVAAGRYLEVADRSDISGAFLASAPKKVTGSIEVVDLPHLADPERQAAGWQAVALVSGVDYAVAA